MEPVSPWGAGSLSFGGGRALRQQPRPGLHPGRGVVMSDRIWLHIDQSGGPDACWPWTARRTADGYGRYNVRSLGTQRTWVAHRLVYEMVVGAIPDGLQVDHRCHVASECIGGPSCPHRRCCNPTHLEPTTLGDNVRRGNAGRSRPAHCRYGHPFDAANTHVRPSGYRTCRTCHARRRAAWESRKQQQ
jgi:hypothetical protein